MFIRKYEENGKELPLPLLPWLNLFPVYNRYINYVRPTLCCCFLHFCRLVQSLTLSVPGVRWMRFCGGVHLVRPEVRLARPPLHINIPCLHIYHFPHTTIHYKSLFLFYTDTGFSSCFLLWSFTKFHRGLINRSIKNRCVHHQPVWRQSGNLDSRTSSTMTRRPAGFHSDPRWSSVLSSPLPFSRGIMMVGWLTF